LKLHGNKKLRRIIVSRKPVSAKIQYIADLVTFGGWTQNMKKLNYDDIYHLFMIVELDDGTLFKLEKNSRVDITLHDNKLGDTMKSIDNINNTLNDMFNNAEQKYGLERIYRYNPFNTNCQMLLVDLISAINKITPELREYIMQTASMLIESDILKYIAKMATDSTALIRHTIEGGKLNNKKNKRKIRKKY
jgi:hypothetical protein